jgi:predicted nucleic acid-binding protein
MTIVVDASVAVKWVLKEEHSADANAIRSEEGLIAPSLIVVEIGSALWKAVRRGAVSRINALAALRASVLPFMELVANDALHVQAFTLALDLGHPIDDCFYLALAERENAPLVTADEAMIAAARKAKIKVRSI